MIFKELVEGLSIILKNHPELANRKVAHASECGYSGAGFESPITIAVPKIAESWKDKEADYFIFIVSDDDGYRTSRVIAGWDFISSEEK